VRTSEDLRKIRPPLPDFILKADFFPHYKNIFEMMVLYAHLRGAESFSRLYGTETMTGLNDWDAEVLLLAKDAGPSCVFQSLIDHQDPEPWRHADKVKGDIHGVSTNEKLRELAKLIPGTKMYGSLLANLLRNDGKSGGLLPDFSNPLLQTYIKDVLRYSIDRLQNIKVIACLGNDSWKFVSALSEPRQNKSAELGRAVPVRLFGRSLHLVRLYHPSRPFKGGWEQRELEWLKISASLTGN